ncbi:CHAT domain-containing protein [Streptomyces sp. NPDC097610]|uniref:CHAT domain-containing protein n=1 Tax=Streptomyces sp. NPDC097610 TaxID=3157227 RepID=UPI003329F5F4
MPGTKADRAAVDRAALRSMQACTYDEALAYLARVPRSQHSALIAMFHDLRDLMQKSGRPHAVTLAEFFAAHVDGDNGPIRPETQAEASAASGISSFTDLIRRASSTPGLLDAHALLRRHRELLPGLPVRAAVGVFVAEGLDRSENAHVIGALGLLDVDGPSRVAARTVWSRHLLTQGRLRRALHHARGALRLQETVGDATSLIQAHRQLADVLRQMGDLSGCAEVLLRASGEAGRTGGVRAVERFTLQRALIDTLTQLNRNHEAMAAIDDSEEVVASGKLGTDDVRDPMLEVLLVRAGVSEELGAMSGAVRAYRRVLNGPELPHHDIPRFWVTTRLASCLVRSGRGREAVRLLTREAEAAEQEKWDAWSVSVHCALASLRLEHDPSADVDRLLRTCLTDGLHGTWGGFGQAFVIMGDLERRAGNPAEAAECYRYALFLAPGPDHPVQPERLPARAHRILTPERLEELFGGDAAPRMAEELFSPLIASLRARLDSLAPHDSDLPQLRIMARERLFHVTQDPGERAQLAEELADGMYQAMRQDEADTLRELSIPVTEVLSLTRGAEAAASLLTVVLEHHEDVNRLADPQLPLALARLLTGMPGGRQRAFDVLWHHRELRLRNRTLSPIHQDADEAAGQAQPIYEELLSLLVRHGQELRLPDQRPPAVLAFELHEEAKARGIVEGLSRMFLPQPPGTSADQFFTESVVLAQQRSLAVGDRPDRAARWRKNTARLDDLYRQMEGVVPDDHLRLRRADGARLADAIRLLEEAAPAEGMVLASYFVGETQTFCFVLASGRPEPTIHLIPIGRAELHAAAEAIRRTVDGDRSVFPAVPPIRPRRPARLPLNGLGDQLLPFQDLLEGRQLLCVAPHGPLSVLPFGAMRLRDGRHCAEQAAVVYAPSISALEYLWDPEPGWIGAALCVRVASTEDLEDGAAGFEDHELSGPPGWKVTSLTGPEATPQRVFAGLSSADLAYIACHGYRDSNDPENAALMLSDGAARPSRSLDGSAQHAHRKLLRARDLPQGKKMPTRVVLRACSAGWHEPEHPGEDFTGLPRALLREGTQTVIAPVWQVDRDSSAELLDRLTAGLMRGEPVWRALWDAQRHMLAARGNRKHLAHPYHWAAFVPLGNWS